MLRKSRTPAPSVLLVSPASCANPTPQLCSKLRLAAVSLLAGYDSSLLVMPARGCRQHLGWAQQGGIACAETVIDFCEPTRSVRGRRCVFFLVDRCRAGDQDFDHAVDVPRILHACADGHISIMTDSCLDIDQISVQTRDIGFVIGAEVDL